MFREGLPGKMMFEQRPKEVIAAGRASQAEGTAGAKAVRSELAWHVWRPAREPAAAQWVRLKEGEGAQELASGQSR